jgi:hypothetical protein
MSRIVCGIFEASVDADAALESLKREGFARSEVDSFYLSPPGQHDLDPKGGDVDSSAGSRHAFLGAGIGAGIGVLAGIAIGTFASMKFGVVAIVLLAGLGAYVGSFLGAMSKVHHPLPGEVSHEHPKEPRGGRMIAVQVDRPGTEPIALQVLRRHVARDVRRAEGVWRDGSWRDFDPRTPLAPA